MSCFTAYPIPFPFWLVGLQFSDDLLKFENLILRDSSSHTSSNEIKISCHDWKNSYNLDMFMSDYITHQVEKFILQNYVSCG